MSALSPTPPHVAPIVAPLLLGHLWNWCLFGVLVVQLYVYSYNFPQDKALLKLFVYAIFLLETLQTALSGADLYYWFISSYGNLARLTSPHLSAFDVPIIESVVSLGVQFFFAYRIWVLSLKKSRWLCLVICLCSIINAAAAFTSGVYLQILGRMARNGKLKAIAMTWLIGNALADILIAATMLYHLARHKNRDSLFDDHALLRIVRLTIETNIMTGSLRGNCFAFDARDISPRELVHVPVGLCFYPNLRHLTIYPLRTAILGKLYSNTLLVSLNNRVSIREAAASKRETSRSPRMTFAITVRSESSTDSMIPRPPAAYKAGSLADSETDKRVVIGKLCGFLLCLWITRAQLADIT
ncbi:hypothetical protein BJV78DRAFT_1374020 [Lactifluus subvellereus]|nr:hypothetical protein BJV78DRAFT_1374020 [Lactifluus subvellereus]